ncbi:unnamed protein product [Microthlaspi erraticum]|uniref:Transposase MuDR plant domain-containing protein n=1 Tax=Microthlaspi erraticum TaxID=1685480 RepID=A0A6D2KWB8_9BRAS|nr:unnamed protein product [Microthlaspi erraticum]
MQIMVCLASVYGAWTIRDRKWYFEVDKTRGGRMFYLQDDCKHEELVEMVVNDYMLQVNGELLELSYPLPAAMMEKLPTDSPPMFVAKCVVNGCAWKLRAAVKNEPDCFWVTKYVKGHTCSIMDRVAHRRRATPRYIGQLFVERTGLIDGIVPRQIADSMRIMFGLNLTYTTSYRALKFAQVFVRGTPKYTTAPNASNQTYSPVLCVQACSEIRSEVYKESPG